MLEQVTTTLTTVLTWIGSVVTELVGEAGGLNELLPLFAVGIAISVFGFAMKAIRKVTWGA